MPLFLIIYSGEFIYKVKILSHSILFIGGRNPYKGLHSTIERPESVNLVMPPMIIISTTIIIVIMSQLEMYFDVSVITNLLLSLDLFDILFIMIK
jgi:hypothetical protein